MDSLSRPLTKLWKKLTESLRVRNDVFLPVRAIRWSLLLYSILKRRRAELREESLPFAFEKPL